MSKCIDCQKKRDTWADSLKDEGYIGCTILYDDYSKIHDVEAEVVATGWIKTGNGGCINDMLITKNTRSCKHYVR